MTVSIIVAAAKNGVIGSRGGMPWNLPDDLARFKKLTSGHAVIMGRKTYESIGHALPERQNIIITRNPGYRAEGCETSVSFEEALKLAKSEEVFVIGGGEIFKLAEPLAGKIYLTRVNAEPAGDVTFSFDTSEWLEVFHEDHPADDKNEFAFSFINLERRQA